MSTSASQILEPQHTSTVEEFIEAGYSDEMTYYNFSILFKSATQKNIILSSTNIIYDYMDELKSSAVTITMSDDDYVKYKYKPKLFCYDIYGSTELYFVIMALNGICDIKDFTKKTIKALYKNDMFELLNQIYNAETDYIDKNRIELNES